MVGIEYTSLVAGKKLYPHPTRAFMMVGRIDRVESLGSMRCHIVRLHEGC